MMINPCGLAVTPLPPLILNFPSTPESPLLIGPVQILQGRHVALRAFSARRYNDVTVMRRSRIGGGQCEVTVWSRES